MACFFAGVGCAKSRTEIENNLNQLFKTQLETNIEMLAESISESMKTLVTDSFNQVKSSKISALGISQQINISKTIFGDADVNISLNSVNQADLESLDELKSNFKIENRIKDDITNQIKSETENNTSLQKAIESASSIGNDKSKLTDGELNNLIDSVKQTFSPSSDDTSVKTFINQQFETIITNRIKNSNNITNKLNSMIKTTNNIDITNECRGESFNSQIVNISDTVFRRTKVNLSMNSMLQNIVLCKSNNIFNNESLNKAMADVTSAQIAKLSNVTNVKEAYTVTADIKNTISDKTTSLVNGFFNMIMMITVAIVLIVLVAGGGFLFMSKKSGKSAPSGSTSSPTTPNLTNTPNLSNIKLPDVKLPGKLGKATKLIKGLGI